MTVPTIMIMTIFFSVIPSLLISAQPLWQASIAGYRFSNNQNSWPDFNIEQPNIITPGNQYTQFWLITQNYNLIQDELLYKNFTKLRLLLSYDHDEYQLFNILGNIVLCQDEYNKICDINMNFNINDIILQGVRSSSDYIVLYTYFMIVDNDDSSVDEYILNIKNYIFPNCVNIHKFSTNSNIMLKIYYDSVDKSYIDIGNPNDWNTLFGNNNNYLYQFDNFIAYLYGIGVTVKDEKVYDEFITYYGKTDNQLPTVEPSSDTSHTTNYPSAAAAGLKSLVLFCTHNSHIYYIYIYSTRNWNIF